MISGVHLLLPQPSLPHRASADPHLGTIVDPEVTPARGSLLTPSAIVALALFAIGRTLALVRWLSLRPVAPITVVVGSTKPAPTQRAAVAAWRPTVRRRLGLSAAPRVRPRTT